MQLEAFCRARKTTPTLVLDSERGRGCFANCAWGGGRPSALAGSPPSSESVAYTIPDLAAGLRIHGEHLPTVMWMLLCG